MSVEYAIDAAVSALADYIAEEVQDIKHVSREFPNPSYELDMPELSIISLNHDIKPSRQYVKSIADETISPTLIIYHIGYMDFRLQLDLWTDNKEQRQDIAQKILMALQPDIGITSGLTLTLEDYYDTICRVETVLSRTEDTADSAERKEWRFRFELMCHMDVLAEIRNGIMREISFEQSEVQAIDGTKLSDLELKIED